MGISTDTPAFREELADYVEGDSMYGVGFVPLFADYLSTKGHKEGFIDQVLFTNMAQIVGHCIAG